ncbi:MAG TPA: transposase [Streptosporangiaceae bacterium]|nr:transposase [Streptosporangiaceae bacterium]
MPDELLMTPLGCGLRAANARLRGLRGGRDGEVAALRAGLDAARERERRLELRLAELERRLGMDSSDSGTPSSKERIGAKEARRARQQSERERSRDRRRGGQPGHLGKCLARDPDPGERKEAARPAECRRCKAGLNGAQPAGQGWAQVIDVEIVRAVTEWALPGLACPCCGTVTFAAPPPGAHAGSVSYGAVLNAAAVLLTAYGNVPPERAAQLMGMLLGAGVSAGWVDKAGSRLSALLGRAGLDEAMTAALAGEMVLAADETPVNVLGRAAPQPAASGGEEKGRAAGAPHVLIVRTPDGRLTWLRAIPSRRKADVAAGIPTALAGSLITDGYTGYQHLLERLAGIQQCCAHVIRRCRAVTKLSPGGLQSWAGDIIAIPREAHRAAGDARARGDTRIDPEILVGLLERYDQAVRTGITHNRLRDWHDGNHPGYALGRWLRDYREQVLLFTRDLTVHWPNNVSERGAKAAKRHQAVSGYWHSLATLARWCRIRSYLDTSAAHGIPAIDAIRDALAGKPWSATPAKA